LALTCHTAALSKCRLRNSKPEAAAQFRAVASSQLPVDPGSRGRGIPRGCGHSDGRGHPRGRGHSDGRGLRRGRGQTPEEENTALLTTR